VLDFHIQRFTRRCAESGIELKPGETYFSVLTQEGGEVVRNDYAQSVWKGPPENVVGWWKSKAPEPTSQRIAWAPNDVILNYFNELPDASDQLDLRFVLTLLMIRRRILRLEATEKDEQGQEVMTLFCPRDETEHQVLSREPTNVEEIQNKLAALLFGDQRDADQSHAENNQPESNEAENDSESSPPQTNASPG